MQFSNDSRSWLLRLRRFWIRGPLSSRDQYAAAIAAGITKGHRTDEHITNQNSSRAHLVVSFGDRGDGTLYGILIDLAGPDQSENMAQLQLQLCKESEKTTNHNIVTTTLEVIGTGGDVRGLRRASRFNTVVQEALNDAKAIAGLDFLCGDGSSRYLAGQNHGDSSNVWYVADISVEL